MLFPSNFGTFMLHSQLGGRYVATTSVKNYMGALLGMPCWPNVLPSVVASF